MSPIEFNQLLESAGLFRSKQDPELRYQIAVLKSSSPVLAKVYNNWLNRELGLEDLYHDLLVQESASLQLPVDRPVPDQPINPPGC